jgi:hypothetical protein
MKQDVRLLPKENDKRKRALKTNNPLRKVGYLLKRLYGALILLQMILLQFLLRQ